MTTLVIAPEAAGLRRAVNPVSWVVLEELLLASEPTNDESNSTRSCALSVRDLAGRLGLDKDTVARAVQRLIDAGHDSRSQTHSTAGAFARGTYFIDLADGLHLLGHDAITDVPGSNTAVPTPTILATPSRAPRSASRTLPSGQLSLLEL